MRVAILGCGYIGLTLAEQLVDAGHSVYGIRRSNLTAVEATGATAIRGDLTEESTLEQIPTVDAVVFSASSGGGNTGAARNIYVDGLRIAVEHFRTRRSPPDRLVYTSSTGVYGDHGGDWVDEETPVDPQTEKADVLAQAEQIARNAGTLNGTVARIAGIYGPDRWGIERYVERPVTEGYRNHIHRDDVAGAIAHLLTKGSDGHDLVMLADDEPVDRFAFADWLADQLDREPPEKRSVAERLADETLSERAERRVRTSKRCDNARLRSLGYEFTFPTYREGYEQAVRNYFAN